MRKVCAFIDESGAFGWNLDNRTVSTCFVITAIIVEECYVEQLKYSIQLIRDKYFQKGEMKSSKVGQNHKRRLKIIEELMPLPFMIYTYVFDKYGFIDSPGLKFRDSFYKFLNGIVHRELRRNFPILKIQTDEFGTGSYMASFSKYIQKRTDAPSLLGEASFLFENSKSNVLIQLADFFAGTFACQYNQNKISADTPDYLSILALKNPYIEVYPISYQAYQITGSNTNEDEDVEIAEICYKRAVDFISAYDSSADFSVKRQVIVLKHLLQQFMYAEKRGYIPAQELINQLELSGYGQLAKRMLRSDIIGRLRDFGVIISGSSKKGGYKIPSKYQELVDYVNHDTSIILPMLSRLKKCKDTIHLGTLSKQNLFSNPESEVLKKLFEFCDTL